MNVVDQQESKAKDTDERTCPGSRLIVSNNPQTSHSLPHLLFVDNTTSQAQASKYGSMPVDTKVDKVSSNLCEDYILKSTFNNNCQKYGKHECFDGLDKSCKHLFHLMILNSTKDNKPNQYILDSYSNCN